MRRDSRRRSARRRAWVRAGTTVLLLSLLALLSFGSSAQSAEGNQPGLLAPGTYPLRVVSAGTAGTEQQGSVVVQRSGSYLVHTYDLVTDNAHTKLFRAADGSVRVTDFDVAGIFFPGTSSGNLWRPAPDLLGGLNSGTAWGWTRHSSNGGDIVVTTWNTIEPIKRFIGSNGLPLQTQRVNTELVFSGNATGRIDITHIEVVGDPTEYIEVWSGDITISGTPKSVFMTMVMGDLGRITG